MSSNIVVKVVIALVVLTAVVVVVSTKRPAAETTDAASLRQGPTVQSPVPQAGPSTASLAHAESAESAPAGKMGAPVAPAALPRLLELGSTTCIPCKQMVPVLDALRAEYGGKLAVDFVDVWKDETAGKRYGVEVIPTQIFFDSEGRELSRHQGYWPKEEIVARFAEHGIRLEPGPTKGAAR